MTFLSKEVLSVPCRNVSDFRKGLIQIKMCLYKKNYFLLRKHIVWGKFIVLARSLISGCQKVLVWTKICCNKNALFWRNLLAPWKPIRFWKICWFQWKIFVLGEIVLDFQLFYGKSSLRHWYSLRKMKHRHN